MSEISELFQRDSLTLTREDRTAIVQKFREDRERYVAGAKAPRAVKAAGPKPDKPDLGSLELDL